MTSNIEITNVPAHERLDALTSEAERSILLVPANIEGPSDAEPVFASSLHTVIKLAKQQGVPLALHGAHASPTLLEQRSIEWFAPAMFVTSSFASQNPAAVSVALGMISNYLTALFSGRADAEVNVNIYARNVVRGETTKVSYRGPVKGLKDLEHVVAKILTKKK